MLHKKLYVLIKQQWLKLSSSHKKKIIIIFTLLVLYSVAIWLAGILIAFAHPFVLGLLAIAYGLGLRHAVDADHIAAIDNTTRKFMLEGKRPLSIGLYFSLGHSTIVIILSLAIALASSFLEKYLVSFHSLGFFVGTLISSLFLFLVGLINFIALITIYKHFKLHQQHKSHQHEKEIHITGPLAKIFNPLFILIDKTWKIYFVGLLFGLGFDTASEVSLLSISAINSISHLSVWIILLIPLAFTAGMTLIDTANGVLMLFAYGWAYIKPERKFYYNITITLLSILLALGIGSLQLISILMHL
jgi:nickel/cobalt transporter (NiCoT) family protein